MNECEATVSLADLLNRDCQCITVDEERLARELEGSSATAGLYASMRENQPNLFASSPVFIARERVERMQAVVDAVEAAVALPAVRDVLLAWAPPSAQIDHGARGVFLGYDFHLGSDGPKLIEINTNAGGALLNTVLARAQRACCAAIEMMVAGALGDDPRAIEDEFVAMFREEWRLEHGGAPLGRIAIVDDDPQAQFLHPEFLLFRRLFERAGIAAVVADPRELRHERGALRCGADRVDLVYNRLTDFPLAGEACRALRDAWTAGDAVVTPNPRTHALYADKRNLVLLSDPARLRELGLAETHVSVLDATVPTTRIVAAEAESAWWAERKQWFFKPVDGFGSKAAYRGDKLTRGTFEQILSRPYVAQRIVAPSERTIERDGERVPLKLDLRCYVYAGRIQLAAARLYQGQTTNFRTAGGGFAPVFTEREDQAA